MKLRETKIFDPADGFGSVLDLTEILDATLALRGDRWWLFGAGQMKDFRSTQLFSASLPAGAPLSAEGWQITAREEDPSRVAVLADHEKSAVWDLQGGRHCPCYVRGFDLRTNRWVERIYYAGSSANLWGPYTNGFLEWDGERWADQPEPVFVASEEWEHASVYEPNVIYADGLWKMWYVAGSNHENYLIHSYSESEDGTSNWTPHHIFAAPEMKMFDFAVTPVEAGYESVFARVSLGPEPPASSTGLWWCRCDAPSSSLGDWSEPVQIMTAEDRGWHSVPWKPCLRFDPRVPGRRFIFFDGLYRTSDPGPFPYAFTLGCLEIDGTPTNAPS